MKKIINGRKYDTETAELIGYYTYSNPSDFYYVEESLYRKKTGEFFLDGEGGAASVYAETAGSNERYGGEKIIPLTVEEAKEWAEHHLDGDKYEEVFGEVEE